MTDSPSALAGYISSDFGQVESTSYTERIGMNYVKCKVVGNTRKSTSLFRKVKRYILLNARDNGSTWFE